MLINSKKVIKIMEEIAPLKLAESWDNVGFLVGNKHRTINKVMVALEMTDEVIDEAIEDNVDLIITHHPLIFKGLKRISADDPIGGMVYRLIRHDINLYASHTNLDVAQLGLRNLMSDMFKLRDEEILLKQGCESNYKLQVYVPKDNADQVITAMVSSGAGSIGNYDSCTFQSLGEGRFRPLEGASPTIGQQDKVEKVEEIKIETIVRESDLNSVVRNMLKTHPYEVPAYNVVEIENGVEESKIGLGIVGYLTDRLTLKELAQKTKKMFKSDVVKIAGDDNKIMRKIAVINGCGDDFIKEAARAGCDVLITGDIKHHVAHDALQLGLSIIDAGHFETENIYMPTLANLLKQRFEEKNYDIGIVVSEVNTNPFQYIK